MEGTVKWFNTQKGYGFIAGDDDNDYFLHVSGIEAFDGTYPLIGQRVAFETEQLKKGIAAKHAVILGKEV